jgi:hypothetical protein
LCGKRFLLMDVWQENECFRVSKKLSERGVEAQLFWAGKRAEPANGDG